MRDASARPGLLITSLILAGLCFLLYSSCWTFQCINYDDERMLLDHPELFNQPSLTQTFHAIFVEYFPREEPLLLRDLSWVLDSRIFGFGNPAGYHCMNVLYHSVVVALLFLFLATTTGQRIFSLTVSALFLLLAVHTEPVAWVMGRKDILMTLCSLLALITQSKMLQNHGRGRLLWYTLSLFFFAMSLFSKINALVFPGVLFLHALLWPYLRGDRAPSGRISGREILGKLLIFIPHLILACFVYRWYLGEIVANGGPDHGYTDTMAQHFWHLAVADPLVVWKYLQLIFFPNNLSLFYSWPDIATLENLGDSCFALLLLAGFVALGVVLFLRRKDILFYFLSFFIMMIPYFNIFSYRIFVADRYVYFSSFCILALVVALVFHMMQGSRPFVRCLLLLLLGVSAVVNLNVKLQYLNAWRTSESLWNHEIALPKTRVYAFENLATFYYQQIALTDSPSERRKWLELTLRVIKSAENRFWPDKHRSGPPNLLYHLYLIRACVSQVNQDPVERQLEYLHGAEKLNPCFDATLKQLFIFYYREALKYQGEQRKDNAMTSLEYFQKYAYHVFKSKESQAEIETIRKMFLHDFPFVDKKMVYAAKMC